MYRLRRFDEIVRLIIQALELEGRITYHGNKMVIEVEEKNS